MSLYKKKYVTIKDVAKAAGISVSTVSRVLNDKPDVSESTKKKVQQAAEEIGFVRNLGAMNLKNKATRTLGIVFEADFDPFFSEVLKGIEDAARKYHYTNILMNTELDEQNERIAIKTLIEHRVDGLLIIPSRPQLATLAQLIKRNFPVVIIGRDFRYQKVDEIYTNDVKGGGLAAKRLLDQGRRKILFLNSNPQNSAAKMRREGFEKAIKEFEGPVTYEMQIHDTGNYESIRGKAQKIFHKGAVHKAPPFDSVFCFNDMMAFHLVQALREMGIKVPQEVSVIGYDDIIFSRFFSPTLTTIRIDKYQEGFEAFRMLLSRLSGRRKKIKKTVLDVELIVRESG